MTAFDRSPAGADEPPAADPPPPTRRPATTRGHIALTVSVVGTLLMWFVVIFTFSATTAGPDWLGLTLFAFPIVLVAGIALDIYAGWRGDRNRVLAALGGILLLTPLLVFAVVLAFSQLTTRT